MAYLGHKPATGENNSFKILDDISSYTLTFDGASTSVVNATTNTITSSDHRFIQGQKVTYAKGAGGTVIGNLPEGTYYIIKDDKNTIKLASSINNANSNTAISFSGQGVGTAHTLVVAFDGYNTKFIASYDDGSKVHMSRAAQLLLSVNGIVQQPNDTASPTNGFGFDSASIIVFSTAPASTDAFWGNVIANNFATFDITDNKIDNFTGNNSTKDFTLSRIPATVENILVTIDGVIQYPSDVSTVRSYTLSGATLSFTSAPGTNTEIQVRHIGFAAGVGGGGGGVSNFYGRTGAVSLNTTDDIDIRHAKAVGVVTAIAGFVGDLTGAASTITGIATFKSNVFVDGSLNIAGDLVYDEERGRNINITGVSTFGSGSTSPVQINAGIITSTTGIVTYYGDGSKLSGVAGGKWRGYTAGIGTESSGAGIGTDNLDDVKLTGIGNSFQGLYISNGMMIVDNHLEGNHYIGTSYNGLMAGPVNINGVLTVEGNYVVI